ncbi:hypothetical protein JHW43_002607 [Diplocarpon mali]|nr:hypothetical protein JHW43_002607 [Diplocarpon mali]
MEPPSTQTTPAAPRTQVLRSAVVILSFLLFVGTVALFTFLALDILTIPYLTPVAHFLALLVSPFVPLFFPAFVGVFLKVLARPRSSWPKRTTWLLITGSWVFQHLQRAVVDAFTLWGGGDVCGLRECRGEWAEWALVLVVVCAHCAGLRWDAGYVDRWLDRLIAQEAEKRAKEAEEKIARGEVPADLDLEKADFEGLVGADGEKRAWIERGLEEILVAEVLVEAERV